MTASRKSCRKLSLIYVVYGTLLLLLLLLLPPMSRAQSLETKDSLTVTPDEYQTTPTLNSIGRSTLVPAETAAFPENSSSSSSSSPADIRSTEVLRSTTDWVSSVQVLAADTSSRPMPETVATTAELSSPDDRPDTSVSMATPETGDAWATQVNVADTSSGIQEPTKDSTEETRYETRANEISLDAENTASEPTDGATKYLTAVSGISPENTAERPTFEEVSKSVPTAVSAHDSLVTESAESDASPTHGDRPTASTYQSESKENFTSTEEGGVDVPQGNTRQTENSDLPSIQPSLMTSSEPPSTDMTSSTQNTEYFAPDNSSKSPFLETSFHFEISSATEILTNLSANTISLSPSPEILSTEQSTVENLPPTVKENSPFQSSASEISDFPSAASTLLTTSLDPTPPEVTSSMLLSSQATQNSMESSTQNSLVPMTESSVETFTHISLQPVTESSVESSTQNSLTQLTETSVETSTQTSLTPMTESSVESSTQNSLTPMTESSVESSTQNSLTPMTESSVESSTQNSLTPMTESSVESSTQNSLTPMTESSIESSTQISLTPMTESSVESSTQTSLTPMTESSVESSTQTSLTPMTESSVESSTQSSVSSQTEQTVTFDPSADIKSTSGVPSQTPSGEVSSYSSERTMTSSVAGKTSEAATEEITSWSAGRPLNEPSSADERNSLNGGQIAAIVIFSVIGGVTLIAGVIVYCVYKRRSVNAYNVTESYEMMS